MQLTPYGLTKHAEKLLDILRGLYGWSSRSVIAAKLDKKHLSAYDVITLEKLAGRGMIEIRKIKASKGHSWEYRFIEPEERESMLPDATE